MSLSGIERARCYLVLQGLERSLSETIVTCLDTSNHQFLTKEESYGALQRLKQDMGEGWQLSDVSNVDLLPYLDLGHLVQLLNRHVANSRTIPASDFVRHPDNRGGENCRYSQKSHAPRQTIRSTGPHDIAGSGQGAIGRSTLSQMGYA